MALFFWNYKYIKKTFSLPRNNFNPQNEKLPKNPWVIHISSMRIIFELLTRILLQLKKKTVLDLFIGVSANVAPHLEITHPSRPYLELLQRSTKTECNGRASLWENLVWILVNIHSFYFGVNWQKQTTNILGGTDVM